MSLGIESEGAREGGVAWGNLFSHPSATASQPQGSENCIAWHTAVRDKSTHFRSSATSHGPKSAGEDRSQAPLHAQLTQMIGHGAVLT